MLRKRRRILHGATAAVAAAMGVSGARPAFAAETTRAPFGATQTAEVIRQLGASNAAPSKDILFKAPDVAENGAAVPVEITSRIPSTQSLAIVADKNPFPLVAMFDFAQGAEPYASLRIKLAGTSEVRVIVMAGGRAYTSVREVKVVTGGCG